MSARVLRPAGREDAAALAAVHATAFDHPWPAADLAALTGQPGALALAAGAGARLDGFILVRRVLDEAEVLTLAVRPAARGRGLGRGLVDAAASLLVQAGVAELHLEVAADNAAALALYRAAGFAQTGVRRGYYARAQGPGADAVTMRRSLNSAPA